jgi:hypothetical protein
MKNVMRTLGAGLYGLLFLTGCSVAMALSGNPEPNFKAFEVGSSRQQVEIQLGKPVSAKVLENGNHEDTYRFEIGNTPNGHRAMMNLYIDLYTFGIWEIPGTIVEATMGHKEETTIIYDAENRVREIRGYTPPAPSAEVKKAQEEQEKWVRPPDMGKANNETSKSDSK